MPDPVIWSLQAGGNTQSAAAWGVANIARHRRSQETDTVTFTAPGRAVDAAPLFAYSATVTILRGSVVWFVGRVTKVPADGDDQAEAQSYELSGPWWYLDHLVCRQQWNTRAGTVIALSTRLILGQALTGARIATGEVIRETLQYAVTAGAPLTIGTIDPALFAPLDEVKDVTCAEVIKQMLRWHPDCVAWFDYSTQPHPTLHVRARAHLPAANVLVGQPPLARISTITPRHDLLPPSVVIHYEVTGNANGTPTFSIITDAAPAGATGMEFGAACFTLPLAGQSISLTEQRLVTAPIRDNVQADDAADLLAYLTAHFGLLAVYAADPDITAAGITITACSRGLADPDAIERDPAGGTQPDPLHPGQTAPKMRTVIYDDTLANELVEGNIADWMGLRAQKHRITFTYTTDSGSGDGTTPSDVQTYQGTIDLTATDAGSSVDGPQTTVYHTISSFTAADPPPVGLAAAYFASLATLQYSGGITLIEPEASGVAGLGQTLNLTGSAQGAWANMAALIVEETVEVDTGTTSVIIGPPEHLTPQDLIALLRVTRPGSGGGRAGADSPAGSGTVNSGLRASGAPGLGAPQTQLGVTAPTNSACGGGGGGGLPQRPWFVAANGVPSLCYIQSTVPVPTDPTGVPAVNDPP